MYNTKLHLGCGEKYIEGYTHVDLIDRPHIDIQHNIINLPMIKDNSVSVIYASHVLEHLYEHDTHSALTEWYRLLVPGGILRLAVPDFDALVRVYTKTKQLSLVVGALYGAHNKSTNLIDKHKTVYNTSMLSITLLNAGYVNLETWDWRKIFPSDYDDYSQAYVPHADKDSGILISLNMQAQKPQ